MEIGILTGIKKIKKINKYMNKIKEQKREIAVDHTKSWNEAAHKSRDAQVHSVSVCTRGCTHRCAHTWAGSHIKRRENSTFS